MVAHAHEIPYSYFWNYNSDSSIVPLWIDSFKFDCRTLKILCIVFRPRCLISFFIQHSDKKVKIKIEIPLPSRFNPVGLAAKKIIKKMNGWELDVYFNNLSEHYTAFKRKIFFWKVWASGFRYVYILLLVSGWEPNFEVLNRNMTCRLLNALCKCTNIFHSKWNYFFCCCLPLVVSTFERKMRGKNG